MENQNISRDAIRMRKKREIETPEQQEVRLQMTVKKKGKKKHRRL